MHTAVNGKYYSYYAYDYGGERRLKLVGVNSSVDVNAEYMTAVSTLNEPTLYPSAYMVLTNKGYTKHYYAGTERVAARLGGGGNALHHVIDNDEELQTKADMLFKQSLEQVNSRVLNENDLECIMRNKYAKEEFGHWIEGIPYQMKADVECDHRLFKEMVDSMLTDYHNGEEKEVYFYHSDHLGSASWITDFEGIAVQHLQYLPYGEPYIDQRAAGTTYRERFRFTGKEKDEETGYGYFGARYMDHELMTMWLSVDPMADKYPSISPYAYCAWNPVKLVDPDGREFGDYYAQNIWGTWKKIGSDGSDDGKVYVVPFKEDQKKVKRGDFENVEKYELPSLEARNEICDYVEESDQNDNLREYGGTVWENGDNGKQDIRYSKPGAKWYGGAVAMVDQNDYEDFEHVGKRLLLYFHSHFSGEINGIGIIQRPSDSRFDDLQGRKGDIQNVLTDNNSRTGGAKLSYNIMFAMKTKQVYFYTHVGVKFTMSFSDFRTLGGTK